MRKDEVKNLILDVLGDGKKSAVTRERLADVTGCTDRLVRQYIAELRNEGFPIISNSQMKGYYLADKEEELQHYLAENKSRAMKLLVLNKKIADRYDLEHSDQVGMQGV